MVAAIKDIRLTKSYHRLIEEFPVIVKIESEAGEFVEVEDAHAMRNANLELSGGGPYYVLLDTSNGHASATAEANELFASKEFVEKRIGTAIIARSLAAKIVSNFFIRFNKPAMPTKVFTNETDAITWLKNLAMSKPRL